jgi:quinone-modifying oxidoreductase subunit QmoB
MDKKYGVYICKVAASGSPGCRRPVRGARRRGVAVKTHPFLCGKEGVDFLKKDIAEEQHPGDRGLFPPGEFRYFRFDGCIVDRVNLREGVVWSHPRSEFPALTEEEKEDEDNFDRVQMMAEDYLRMGMARVEKIDLPEPYKLENSANKILVIGGGITGMSAAMDAAKAGYDVTIVEKPKPAGRLCAKLAQAAAGAESPMMPDSARWSRKRSRNWRPYPTSP